MASVDVLETVPIRVHAPFAVLKNARRALSEIAG